MKWITSIAIWLPQISITTTAVSSSNSDWPSAMGLCIAKACTAWLSLFKQCSWTNGITSSHAHHRLTPTRPLAGNLESTSYFCGFEVAKAITFPNYLLFVSTEKFNNKTYFSYYAWPTGIWTDMWSNQKPFISYFLEYPIALWSHWSLSHILHPQWRTKSTLYSIWQCREVLLAGSSRYICMYLLTQRW